MKRLMIQFMGILLLTVMVVPGLLAQQADQNENGTALVLSNGETLTQNADTDKLLKQIISIQLEGASLEEALEVVSRQADLKLMYSKSALPENTTITLQKSSLTLYDALWKILEDTGLRFGISQNGQLVILKQEEAAKEIILETVSGTVTDAQTGETLPGVNVLVKGTTTGTSSDSEGGFELNVPSLQDTLVFSFIGYQTQEVTINGRTSIDVELQSQAVSGEELVVIGYSQRQRGEITGSVANVSGESVARSPVNNITQSIQGKIAGVIVNDRGGEPGDNNAEFLIRGQATLGNNDPLIVIDGVPREEESFANLSPNDIESISVLKDASAAIYGSRAANGVILVSTKRGSQANQLLLSIRVMGWRRLLSIPKL
ncbi:MAG: carboxypeptidase-like regulatory domain-containing protein [Balneolaceae bacterium]|nr:carboxypeptidase-like regulatory domain-containing protein [Balneolaceae bacterium]